MQVGSDHGHELREGLITAIAEIPVFASLGNRRLLISLIRRDTPLFPEVEERPEARMHVVDLVLVCLEQPTRLRALRDALSVIAPDDGAARRACALIDSATLLHLLPEAEIRKARDLLGQAADPPDMARWWRLASDLAPGRDLDSIDRVGLFDLLLRRQLSHDYPPALALVAATVQASDDPVASRLRTWLEARTAAMFLFPELPGMPAATGGATSTAPTVYPNHSTEPYAITDEYAANPHGSSMPVARVPTVVHDQPNAAGDEESPRPEREDDAPESGDTMPPVITDEAAKFGSKLPSVWGDIPPRNPNFTGREELLELLHMALSGGRETAVLAQSIPQAVHGMAGVGKSQLAIEFVHRHRSEFDLVWWIPAEQESQILSSLTRLVQDLRPDSSPEANTALPAVREALSTGKPYTNWLLVFDNAESLDEVRAYFPTGGTGKILVTSRNPEWASLAQTLEVDVFTRQESKDFLRGRTPDLTELDADRLAEALGDLPLAIEQAAAWRAATGMPVDDYLTLLASKRMELLEDTSPDYQTSVAAAWNMSLDKVELENPAALELLQLCSYYGPDPISRELFTLPAGGSVSEALDVALREPVALGRAIRSIKRYALAKLDHQNNTIQIHRLVQAVLARRMSPEKQEVMRRSAHTLLAGANPHFPARRTSWDRYQALLPHVMASGLIESQDTAAQLLAFEMVQFLYHWGDHSGAVELAEELYDQWKTMHGEGGAETLKVAKYLGYIKRDLGDVREASELFEGALRIYLETVGEEDEGALDAMRMVGLVCRATGDFARALELHERGYDICHRLFGADDPLTLQMANSLGISLRLMGNFDEAVKRDEDTYRRYVDVYGLDAFDTLLSFDNLNVSQREAGKYIIARHQCEEGYKRAAVASGPGRPQVWRVARNLAVAYRRAGDHARALTLAQDTADKFRQRYGDDHPDTMAACLSLAIDLRHDRRLDDAWVLGNETLARYKKMFGPDHPFTLSARINLAVVMRLQKFPSASHEMNEKTRAQLNAILRPDHPITLSCVTNLASDLYFLGKLEAAFELDTDTLARSERVLGLEHPSTLAVGVNLAMDLRARGSEQQAEVLHADTMKRFRRSLGEQHPATLNALKNLRADCDVDIVPI